MRPRRIGRCAYGYARALTYPFFRPEKFEAIRETHRSTKDGAYISPRRDTIVRNFFLRLGRAETPSFHEAIVMFLLALFNYNLLRIAYDLQRNYFLV